MAIFHPFFHERAKMQKVRSRAGKMSHSFNGAASGELCIVSGISIKKIGDSSGSRAGKKFEKNRGVMKKGLSKKQRETTVYFTEADSVIEVQTHNTSLKKRLATYAALYPQCCRQTDEDGQGGLTFEIEKGRLSFRLTAPYSEERKEAASVYARRNSLGNLPNVSDV